MKGICAFKFVKGSTVELGLHFNVPFLWSKYLKQCTRVCARERSGSTPQIFLNIPANFQQFGFLLNIFKIEVQLIYNVVLVSGIQQSDPDIYIYVYMYIHIKTHTYIHVYIYTYIYTHTFSDSFPLQVTAKYLLYFPALNSKSMLSILYTVVCVCNRKLLIYLPHHTLW